MTIWLLTNSVREFNQIQPLLQFKVELENNEMLLIV